MVRIQRTLVSLIIRSGAGVLLLQRGQPYSEFLRHDPDTQVGIDLWELPGGGLDFGETPPQAAVRETSEETGISIKGGNPKLVACCAYTLKGSECESPRAHIIYEVDVGAASDVKHSKEHAAPGRSEAAQGSRVHTRTAWNTPGVRFAPHSARSQGPGNARSPPPLAARRYDTHVREVLSVSNQNRYNSFAMRLSAQWYRENAHACAWRAEQSCDPSTKAAYKEMVRAWLILAIGVEELVRHPLPETRSEEQVLAA